MRSNGTAVAIWHDVGAPILNTRGAGEWALQLHRGRLIWLTPNFELPFLRRCSTWVGRLTPRMQPIFRRILDRVCTSTGLQPPP